MEREKYDRSLPERVRVKVVRLLTREPEPDFTFNEEDLRSYPQLVQALREADEVAEKRRRELSENYGVEMREDWVWTLPDPVTVSLGKEEFWGLADILKKKGAGKLDEKTYTVKYGGKLYRLGVEYPCG